MPRSRESLEAELTRLRKEIEELKAGGNGSFAPNLTMPMDSSVSIQQYPSTPGATKTPSREKDAVRIPEKCKGCASKAKSYESLVKKTRDMFQHYRTVVYELTGG